MPATNKNSKLRQHPTHILNFLVEHGGLMCKFGWLKCGCVSWLVLMLLNRQLLLWVFVCLSLSLLWSLLGSFSNLL